MANTDTNSVNERALIVTDFVTNCIMILLSLLIIASIFGGWTRNPTWRLCGGITSAIVSCLHAVLSIEGHRRAGFVSHSLLMLGHFLLAVLFFFV